MKVLTLTEPWATLMKLGEKNIETRSWSTNHRGLLAIHAAKSVPKYAREFCNDSEVIAAFLRRNEQQWFKLGYILCVRKLINILPTENVKNILHKERIFGDYSPGRFAWIFSDDIKILSIPIKTNGSLGLWNYEL